MSVSRIHEASQGATGKQASVQKMLIENSQLIETVAEYQRLGRMEDAAKYRELLHQNLTFLGSLVDTAIAAQLQDINGRPADPNAVAPTQPAPEQQQNPQMVMSQPMQPQFYPNNVQHPAYQQQRL